MLENVIFSLLAFSLFIIIFFKIIRKDDSNYIILLTLQGFGIAISFFEIKLRIKANFFFRSLRYLLSIILPVLIIYLEWKEINFSEILNVFLANCLNFIGDTKGAKAILSKLVSKYPDSYYAHKLLAVIYEKEGGMRKAIDEYVTAIDLKKNDYDSYYKISELLRDLGKKDEAIEMLEKLVRNKPDMYEASCLLGDMLCEQERFKEAASVYENALKFRPADFELYYNLGIVYTRLNDFQMAKDMYERAASINHKLWGTKYNLGQLALIEKEYNLAEQYFKESLYDKNLEAMSYYQLARIYARRGEKDKALEFLNKSIELDHRLLKRATKEKAFQEIKELITVSVKMDDESEKDRRKEIEEEVKELEESHILVNQEKATQEYLEDTYSLIQDISENTTRQRTIERVSEIINQEKLKQLKEKDEYQEMLNALEQEGVERTKQEDDGTPS